mmetsp:Transcript_103067/g.291110  ORF Transcript_103067/g.291110 Transcript_103067/m.291110 type:complete len:396 (-) Transcript_103067:1636-2823(-)
MPSATEYLRRAATAQQLLYAQLRGIYFPLRAHDCAAAPAGATAARGRGCASGPTRLANGCRNRGRCRRRHRGSAIAMHATTSAAPTEVDTWWHRGAAAGNPNSCGDSSPSAEWARAASPGLLAAAVAPTASLACRLAAQCPIPNPHGARRFRRRSRRLAHERVSRLVPLRAATSHVCPHRLYGKRGSRASCHKLGRCSHRSGRASGKNAVGPRSCRRRLGHFHVAGTVAILSTRIRSSDGALQLGRAEVKWIEWDGGMPRRRRATTRRCPAWACASCRTILLRLGHPEASGRLRRGTLPGALADDALLRRGRSLDATTHNGTDRRPLRLQLLPRLPELRGLLRNERRFFALLPKRRREQRMVLSRRNCGCPIAATTVGVALADRRRPWRWRRRGP